MFLALVYEILSRLLSIPDVLFPLLNSLPGGPKFFTLGYGNPKVYFDRRNSVLKSLANGSYNFERKQWELVETKRSNGIVTSAGQFTSPVANLLPKESQTCYFQLIEPSDENKKKEVYVVMFPATGEMGGGTRRTMAQKLALEHGWSTVIITAPFYGRRKPASQKLFFIDSVCDILLQSEAIIEEGMLLTDWLLNKKSSNKQAVVCHTGFSYGAAMASCTSAMSLAGGLDGSRIAVAPYVGSSSPNVLADGVLESAVSWKALAQNPREDYGITRKKLYDLCDETQLSVLAKPAARDTKISIARCISFSNDGFIGPKYSKSLESQLVPLSSVPARVQWYPGGHAFAALVRPYLQKRHVEKTVNELVLGRAL